MDYGISGYIAASRRQETLRRGEGKLHEKMPGRRLSLSIR
jgi:hypothetical protein